MERSAKCPPSKISMKPIRIRNERPSICMVGFLFTNLPTGTANSIMMIIENITDIIIIISAPYIPFVIPTAVSIESKEKTMLIKVICTIADPRDILFLFEDISCSTPSNLLCISETLLYSKNIPPAIRIMLWPEKPAFIQPISKLNHGSFMAIKTEMPKSRMILKTMARNRPIVVAFFLSFSSNLDEAMEIKIILSTPSTISKKVKVIRLSHTEELANDGMSMAMV